MGLYFKKLSSVKLGFFPSFSTPLLIQQPPGASSYERGFTGLIFLIWTKFAPVTACQIISPVSKINSGTGRPVASWPVTLIELRYLAD